jgi:hypothetical protein
MKYFSLVVASSARSTQGVALIETALTLPLLLLLMLNVVNFGMYMFAWTTVNDAARAAAEYKIYNGVAIGFPGSPTGDQVRFPLVTTALSSLPSTANPNFALKICSNNNNHIDCDTFGKCPVLLCLGPPPDPSPAAHVLYSVDIVYTYMPLFSAFSIPSANIYLTLPTTTIHRQVVMRSMQ